MGKISKQSITIVPAYKEYPPAGPVLMQINNVFVREHINTNFPYISTMDLQDFMECLYFEKSKINFGCTRSCNFNIFNKKLMTTDLDNYYFKQPEPTQSCLLALRSIIMKADANITHQRKFQLPFFYYKNFKLCFFWVKQKKLYLGFIEDRKSFPPSSERTTNPMELLLIKPDEDLPVDLILEKLRDKINLYEANQPHTR